jgi:NitT/TauT family transport system substrate-binding protein
MVWVTVRGFRTPRGGWPRAGVARAGRCVRRGVSALAAGTIALSAGCSGAAPASPAPLEKTTIVVGAVPAADSAGLYIAQEKGYFAAAGLNVKIVNIISSEDAIAAQVAGQYDVTLGNYVSYVQADAQQHANLRIIAEGSVIQQGDQAIVALQGSRITSLSGLTGKRLAVNVLNNIGTILIGSALAEQGIPLSSVTLVPIPFPLMVAALKERKVDAMWIPEPFLSSAEEQVGAQPVYDLDQGAAAGLPIVGYAVTRTWEQKYPRTAAAFTKALERGQLLADLDRSVVEKAVEKYLGVPPITAAVMAIPDFPLGVDVVRLQRIADGMRRFGILNEPYNVSQMAG